MLTRSEAIDDLELIRPFSKCSLQEAIDFAIQELKKKPCEDAISRQAVKNYYPYNKKFHAWLDEQPSVTPAQKVGKRIRTKIRVSSGDFTNGVICSACGYVTVVDDFKYCPNCGEKKMKEGDEDGKR